jgi:photosystem II stability/assembly factor-like uncharacterized protein
MSDKLDTQIRILVMELVDAAPPAPSLHELEDIERGRASAEESPRRPDGSVKAHDRTRRVRRTAVLVACAAVLVVAGVLVVGGGGGTPTPQAGRLPLESGTWSLADDVLSGTWSQYTNGPPRGSLTCPTVSVCYVMSGHYKTPYAGAPLLGVSMYASSDGGQIWTAHPMPNGFAPTSQIACGSATDCAAGGTHNGQAVLAATNDGGVTWALDPLPSGIGNLDALSCPSESFCAGLAAKSKDSSEQTTDATFLFTTDGGTTFTDEPLVRGDSMQSLSCSSDQDCTAIGFKNDIGGSGNFAAGASARTTDGGTAWLPGTIPDGLGVEAENSALSCADAQHCWMTGLIALPSQNPPQCAGKSFPEPPGTTTPTTSVQSPAVAAVAQAESAATAKEFQEEAGSPQYGCSFPGWPLIIGALASTSDGGLSWTPDSIPADVPQPLFDGLSCPTDSQCWVTGSDVVPRVVGTTYDGGQPILLGTTDGGATWSDVTFSVPEGAPDDYSQSYLSLGGISCPSAGSCVALGDAAQSAPSSPVYSFTAQDRANRH